MNKPKFSIKDARYEFDNLRNDDDEFDSLWGCNDEQQQENNFFKWCSQYDDLKHIKRKDKE